MYQFPHSGIFFLLRVGSLAMQALASKIKCWANEIDNANNQGWEKACAWADWWGQPKVTQMFTKSFIEMSDADWAVCPRTTNAVESQNKKGCSKTKSFRDVVSNFYLEDKSICFSTFAAREGIKTGTPITTRKIQNEKRRLNRHRPKIIEDDQSPTPSTTEGTQYKSKKRKLTATQDAPETSEDENLGKTVFIDTYGARGRKFGWCKATVIKKKGEGYVAKYISDKKTTFIPDINDEKFVRFYSSEELDA